MNKIPESQILIIFGASGDLTHRKLIPSLFELFERKLLPDKFLIVGVSRTKQSTEEFRQSLHSSIIGNGKTYATDNPYLKNFLREIYYRLQCIRRFIQRNRTIAQCRRHRRQHVVLSCYAASDVCNYPHLHTSPTTKHL